MAKFVKPIVVAASVAAVIGVGAVSFAAWSTTGKDSQSQSGATGDIRFMNIDDDVVKSGAVMTGLIPFDQDQHSDSTHYVGKIVLDKSKITLGEGAVSGTITITAAPGATDPITFSTSGDDHTELFAKVKGGSDTYADAKLSSNSGWTQITGTSNKLVYNITASTDLDSDGHLKNDVEIWFILDSNQYAQHSKNFTVTIALAEAYS